MDRALKRPAVFLILVALFAGLAFAGDKPSFTVGWSIYVGWNPYYYMAKSGILKRWADKYNVEIKVQRFDYAPSLDAFVAKNIDACTMTNMEALDMPAASGVDTTAILIGDYSNGNDAVLVRNGSHVPAIARQASDAGAEDGLRVSVRARDGDERQQNELKKVKFLNTSDSDIVAAFMNNAYSGGGDVEAAGVADTRAEGRVYDLRFVENSRRNFGLAGGADRRAEPAGRVGRSDSRRRLRERGTRQMAQLTSKGPAADKAMAGIAAAAGDTIPSFKEQLSTTHLFYTPQSAAEFAQAAELKTKMDLVRQFCFRHGLLGENTASPDDVAVLYPDKTVQGKKDRVRLRFDASYMQMAAQGKL